MSQVGSEFLPVRLRPHGTRRRPRSRLVLMALLPGLLLLLPWWRLQAVEIEGCDALPPGVADSLRQLRGSSPLTLDLQLIRERLELYPAVAGVELYLELPGTLHVSARRPTICASVAVGRRWHGVACDGHLAGPLDRPEPPLLEGFAHDHTALRQGLAVAERLGRATGAAVESVERVMPDDLRATIVLGEPSGQRVVVHVGVEASASERLWCARLAGSAVVPPWADLRRDDRIVQRSPVAPDGGSSTDPGEDGV